MTVRLIKRLWISFSESIDIASDVIDNMKLDHLEVKLDRILRKLFPEEIKLKRPHGIPAFPLRTEEEWENLEEILADDDAFTYVVNISTVYLIFSYLKLHVSFTPRYCMF